MRRGYGYGVSARTPGRRPRRGASHSTTPVILAAVCVLAIVGASNELVGQSIGRVLGMFLFG